MSIRLYPMTHTAFTPPPDPLYAPLHVGRALSPALGYPGDDRGDSISRLNPHFCELTGLYWLWKNVRDVEYIGVCHYRRYLLDEDGGLFAEKRLKELLNSYDILTPKLLTLSCSYREGFCANHHERDFLLTEEAIGRLYPDCLPLFRELANGPHTYFGNMFITSKALYDRYCEWLFPLLFAVREHVDFTGYSPYQQRLFGFLAEFLQTVWIRYQGLRGKECMVGMVGEKTETRLVKEKLAACFSRGDYVGAKKCFLEAYEKRPDVLMEASDVNGELRLAMQIISTCEFEAAAYGSCILDRIRDYPALAAYFRRLNRTVNSFLASSQSGITGKDGLEKLLKRRFPKGEAPTPAALDIAVRLFAQTD